MSENQKIKLMANIKTDVKTSVVVWTIGIALAAGLAFTVVTNKSEKIAKPPQLVLTNSILTPSVSTILNSDSAGQTLLAFDVKASSADDSLIQVSQIQISATSKNGKASNSLSKITNFKLYLQLPAQADLKEINADLASVTPKPAVLNLTFNNLKAAISYDNSGVAWPTDLIFSNRALLGSSATIILKGDLPVDGIGADTVQFQILNTGVKASISGTTKKLPITISSAVKGDWLQIAGGINDPSTCDTKSCPAGYLCKKNKLVYDTPGKGEQFTGQINFFASADPLIENKIAVNKKFKVAFIANDNGDKGRVLYKTQIKGTSSGDSEKSCTSRTLIYDPSYIGGGGLSGPCDVSQNRACVYEYARTPSCSVSTAKTELWSSPGAYLYIGRLTTAGQYSSEHGGPNLDGIDLVQAEMEVTSEAPTGTLTVNNADIANGSAITLTANLKDDFGFKNDLIIVPQYKSSAALDKASCGWRSIPAFIPNGKIKGKSCVSGKSCKLNWTGNITMDPGDYTLRVVFADSDYNANYATAEVGVVIR